LWKRVKKIPSIVDNLSESEKKRRELSTTIQKLKRSGAKLKDIVAITGKDPRTVRKYMEGGS
jgi:hypothetical protein